MSGPSAKNIICAIIREKLDGAHPEVDAALADLDLINKIQTGITAARVDAANTERQPPDFLTKIEEIIRAESARQTAILRDALDR